MITIKVKGMMCKHCEAHVKKALEALDGVKCATADHEKCEVVIDTAKDIDESLIEKTIKDEGYEYLGIKA